MVTLENYEEYLVMQADGELDAAGQQQLEAFLQLHPELRDEQALYSRLHLTPDTTQVYSEKQALLRQEPAGKVIPLGSWWRYGAAAGIIALLAVGIMKWSRDDTQHAVAVTDTAKAANAPQVAAIDSTPVIREDVAIKPQEIKREAAPERKAQAVPRQVQKIQIANNENKEEKVLPEEAMPERPQVVNVKEPDDIPEVKQVQESPKITAKYNEVNEPAPIQPAREVLAWLPISSEKRDGLSEMGEAINARVKKVKEIRDSLKNTDVAVKLGKKELFTIRF